MIVVGEAEMRERKRMTMVVRRERKGRYILGVRDGRMKVMVTWEED